MTRTNHPLRTISTLLLVLLTASLAGCGGGGGGMDDGPAPADGSTADGGTDGVDLDELTYVSDGTFDGSKAYDILLHLASVPKWRATPFSGFINTYAWRLPIDGDQGGYSQDRGFDVFFGEISWLDTGRVGPYPAAVLWTHHGQYDTAELVVITGPDSYIHEIGNANNRYQTTYIPD